MDTISLSNKIYWTTIGRKNLSNKFHWKNIGQNLSNASVTLHYWTKHWKIVGDHLTENAAPENVKENSIGKTELNKASEINIPSSELIKSKRVLSVRQREALEKGRNKLKEWRLNKMVQESEKKVEASPSDKEDTGLLNELSKKTKSEKPEKPVRKYRRRKTEESDESEDEDEYNFSDHRERERVVVKERNNDNDGLIILSIIGIIAMVIFFLFRLGVVKAPVRQVEQEDYSEAESPLETSSGAHPVFISRDG